MTIPVAALRHANAGDYVYAVNAAERTVSLRPVERGLATADRVQIVSGLKAGEQVITEGADRLKDGASVVLPGDGPKSPNGGAGGMGTGKRQRASGPADGTRPGVSSSADGVAAPGDASSAQRRRRASQAEGA